jgi:hypothetical protein
MKKNTITFSALRASEQKSDVSFYDELSIKTLITIGELAEYKTDRPIGILDIKRKMGINFAALAKITNNLKSKNYIHFTLAPTVSEPNQVTPNDVDVNLTSDGLNLIIKNVSAQTI